MRFYTLTESALSKYDSEHDIVSDDILNLLQQSQVRNRKGELLVCYHGTNAEFEQFSDEFIGNSSGNIGWFGKGFYFTTNKKQAQSYGKYLKKFYLNIKHPFIYSNKDSIWELYRLGLEPRIYNGRLAPFAYLTDESPIENFTQTLKDAGYDGVIFSYRQAGYKDNITANAKEIVCFYPHQIIEI